jgi:hypothetical protein
MRWEVGHHLTVVEFAAVACGAGEDAVHRGREPDDTHEFAELGLCRGCAVELGRAFRPALLVYFQREVELAVYVIVAQVGGERP